MTTQRSNQQHNPQPITFVDAFVYPNADCANPPQLYVVVDGEAPKSAEWRYRRCENCPMGRSTFIAEHSSGLVEYRAEGPHDGSRVEPDQITLLDGSEYHPASVGGALGPKASTFVSRASRWSTSASASPKDHPAADGPADSASLATADELVAAHCPEWEIALRLSYGEPVWEPRLKGHGFKSQDSDPYYAMKDMLGGLRRD